jgi:hypothetical protein
MTKNKQKYNSYRYSFSRINEAIKAKFFIEAVMIEESLISDRILSVLVKNNCLSEKELNKLPQFASLIERTKSLPSPFESASELHEWREKRNKITHAIAKSLPGQPTITTKEFTKLARETAKTGLVLCNKIKRWSCQKQPHSP